MQTGTLYYAAGNGLLDRRNFLRGGLLAGGAVLSAPVLAGAAEPRQSWMQSPGLPLSGTGDRSPQVQGLQRYAMSIQPGTLGSGASRTPLEHLRGTITPADLHFERHHSGIPEIDPAQHSLTISGQVQRTLRFSMEDLLRYPQVTRQLFLECSGNSAVQLQPDAVQRSAGELHGLVSGSEWVGVPVSVLLDEAGLAADLDLDNSWVGAEGADAARMNRSIPLRKMLDDALLATYQNGEPLRPSQGYPLRLLLPGYEGNTSIKWLHRLEVSNQPAMSRQETSKYTDLYSDGRAEMFTFDMGVKSLITAPSPGSQMGQPGIYEVTGLAWSGTGLVKGVEVSADGGQSWAQAELMAPVLDKALTRFRIAWYWRGQPATLISRARDQRGEQPTRSQLLKERGTRFFYHYNAQQPWRVDQQGQLHNVHL